MTGGRMTIERVEREGTRYTLTFSIEIAQLSGS